MRGCLTFLVFLAVLVGIVGWFALPGAASFAISTALTVGGFSGTNTHVSVSAEPPYELATLHADRVHVTSTAVAWRDVRAGGLDVTLSDVDLGARTFAGVQGRLTNVTVATAVAGPVTADLVTIRGSGTRIVASLTVPPAQVRRLASAAAAGAIGGAPTQVTLAAPDRVTLVVAGRSVAGRLAVDAGGGLVMRVEGVGTVDVLRPGGDLPFRLTSATISRTGALAVGAVLDRGAATALLERAAGS